MGDTNNVAVEDEKIDMDAIRNNGPILVIKKEVVNAVKTDELEKAKYEDMNSDQLPTTSCSIPTFVDIHRNDYVENPSETSLSERDTKLLNSSIEDKEALSSKVIVPKVKRTRKRVKSNSDVDVLDDKPYKCPECHWQFKVQYRFKRHMRTHTGEKPYECHECGKRFNRTHILKVHMMIHTGEKPFKCEQCGWPFMKKYHLQRHLRTHSGEKPYICTVCGVHFSRQNHLKKHLLNHESKKDVKISNNSSDIQNESSSGGRVEVEVSIVLDPSKGEGKEELYVSNERVEEKSSDARSTSHLKECIDVLNHLVEKSGCQNVVDMKEEGVDKYPTKTVSAPLDVTNSPSDDLNVESNVVSNQTTAENDDASYTNTKENNCVSNDSVAVVRKDAFRHEDIVATTISPLNPVPHLDTQCPAIDFSNRNDGLQKVFDNRTSSTL